MPIAYLNVYVSTVTTIVTICNPVTESRENGNPIHSQNFHYQHVDCENASYCHFESFIFKIKFE